MELARRADLRLWGAPAELMLTQPSLSGLGALSETQPSASPARFHNCRLKLSGIQLHPVLL